MTVIEYITGGIAIAIIICFFGYVLFFMLQSIFIRLNNFFFPPKPLAKDIWKLCESELKHNLVLNRLVFRTKLERCTVEILYYFYLKKDINRFNTLCLNTKKIIGIVPQDDVNPLHAK